MPQASTVIDLGVQATADAESPALPGHDDDDSADAESDLELFAPAHENQVGARDVLDMLPNLAAAAQVRAQIHDVIEAEGPIEVSRLARNRGTTVWPVNRPHGTRRRDHLADTASTATPSSAGELRVARIARPGNLDGLPSSRRQRQPTA